ncbi:MAG: hypothetical protein M1834_009086 [Cirrosporium novae-zelandiae]|nr:MAG: hypothetical protein M1834_009086 [Cirrosporium novae-zelandiae]
MPQLQRTFSFTSGDEESLSHPSTSFDQHRGEHVYPYQDSPSPVRVSHRSISPPPAYGSPSPERREPVSPITDYNPSTFEDSGPAPPPHRNSVNQDRNSSGPDHRYWGTSSQRNSAYMQPTTTPGADNLGAAAAGGGLAGIAMGVAHTHQRDSGVEAVRAMENIGGERTHYDDETGIGTDNPYVPVPPEAYSRGLRQHDSYDSTIPLGAAAATPGSMTPRHQSTSSEQSISLTTYPSTGSGMYYTDSPYNRHSSYMDLPVHEGTVDPRNIADDGDDGFIPDPHRKSILSRGHDKQNKNAGAAAAATGAAATGGVMGAIGGIFGKGKTRDVSNGSYGPVSHQLEAGTSHGIIGEKSAWLSKQTQGNRKFRWVVGGVIGAVIIAAVVGGVIGAVVAKKHQPKTAAATSTSSDSDTGLTRSSVEIQDLLNNDNLHKVFPGMDYTPFNAQYPDCLTNPPSQDNITKDVAVLSQLTPAIRLYGTDCNQTEMVLHALDVLDLNDTLKIWLGVWLDTNVTTNNRQLKGMYEVLDKYPTSHFKGVIVGNEVLYREDMSQAKLASTLREVKSNLTDQGVNLKIATSDLGDDWTSGLVDDVDIVMSNVHPFFAGVTAANAASWTWLFWDTHDVVLTAGNSSKGNIISEVGWPSGGGNDCGSSTCSSKTAGSVAGIDEMNTFMDSWVCEALTNGTEYFWFEAFDEPWKVKYNTATEKWEDKWGLMDSGRNLKDGVKIPSCNGNEATLS